MNARPTAVLAELEALTTRALELADAYERRVKHTLATWPNAGRVHKRPVRPAHAGSGSRAVHPGGAPGGGAAR